MDSIAFVYGTPLGAGGLGVQSANALRALALTGLDVHAIGPGPAPGWTPGAWPNVCLHSLPPVPARWIHRSPLRWRTGLAQWLVDRRTGRFARERLERIRPSRCYAFTQVALESLRWAKRAGVATVLESPNGHIRPFRDVYVGESQALCGEAYTGHPAPRMVERVLEEYALADRIRVSSEWARRSLVEHGVLPGRITCLQQPVDLERFTTATEAAGRTGPLRACFVGSLDLRKGFVYLLRGARLAGRDVHVTLVGGTGDRCCRQLLERERHGVTAVVAPGDPRPALARSDVFVLPTLEDGSPFATAEAMASGVPVITTRSNGGAEWVRAERTGWLVEARSADAIAEALASAAKARESLPAMGLEARRDTEARAGAACDRHVGEWVTA
jgi:glycosyltransferase involved in cell wall biosynthesis